MQIGLALCEVFSERNLVRGRRVRIFIFFLRKHLQKNQLCQQNKPSEVILQVEVKFFPSVENISCNVCFNYRKIIKETCEGCSFCDLMIAAFELLREKCCHAVKSSDSPMLALYICKAKQTRLYVFISSLLAAAVSCFIHQIDPQDWICY